MERKTIVAFDFDGTLILRDSFIDFAYFSRGRIRTWIALTLHAPLILWKDKGRIKESVFSFLYKGMSYSEFKKTAQDYSLQQIPPILNQDVYTQLKEFQAKGYETIIISASLYEWIAPWAQANGINTVLSTQIETNSDTDRLTGRFSTPNCKGEEKVNRLNSLYPDRNSYRLYAFGDSSGDEALLAYADKSFRVGK